MKTRGHILQRYSEPAEVVITDTDAFFKAIEGDLVATGVACFTVTGEAIGVTGTFLGLPRFGVGGVSLTTRGSVIERTEEVFLGLPRFGRGVTWRTTFSCWTTIDVLAARGVFFGLPLPRLTGVMRGSDGSMETTSFTIVRSGGSFIGSWISSSETKLVY